MRAAPFDASLNQTAFLWKRFRGFSGADITQEWSRAANEKGVIIREEKNGILRTRVVAELGRSGAAPLRAFARHATVTSGLK
jgi:hypothetical protein